MQAAQASLARLSAERRAFHGHLLRCLALQLAWEVRLCQQLARQQAARSGATALRRQADCALRGGTVAGSAEKAWCQQQVSGTGGARGGAPARRDITKKCLHVSYWFGINFLWCTPHTRTLLITVAVTVTLAVAATVAATATVTVPLANWSWSSVRPRSTPSI